MRRWSRFHASNAMSRTWPLSMAGRRRHPDLCRTFGAHLLHATGCIRHLSGTWSVIIGIHLYCVARHPERSGGLAATGAAPPGSAGCARMRAGSAIRSGRNTTVMWRRWSVRWNIGRLKLLFKTIPFSQTVFIWPASCDQGGLGRAAVMRVPVIGLLFANLVIEPAGSSVRVLLMTGAQAGPGPHPAPACNRPGFHGVPGCSVIGAAWSPLCFHSLPFHSACLRLMVAGASIHPFSHLGRASWPPTGLLGQMYCLVMAGPRFPVLAGWRADRLGHQHAGRMPSRGLCRRLVDETLML